MLAQDLSLHILTKNEEDFIPHIIKRLRPFVGEIIVTDTGSTDWTVELALKAGARVCSTTMERGFGEARNEGLAFVTLPWILQVDADEWPSDNLLKWLAKWTPTDDIGGAFIHRHNLVGGEPIGERTHEWHPRIFRSGYRFIGRIHEGLGAPKETFIKAPENALLCHYKTVKRQERQNAFYATF